MFFYTRFKVLTLRITTFANLLFLDKLNRFGFILKLAKNDKIFIVSNTLTFNVSYVIDNKNI